MDSQQEPDNLRKLGGRIDSAQDWLVLICPVTLVALLRWNLFSYRNLWEWINRPFDTPPEPALQLQPNLDSIGASG